MIKIIFLLYSMNYYIINKKDIDKVDSKYIDYCCKRENEIVLYCDKSCYKGYKM
jgi:hypothetical protein